MIRRRHRDPVERLWALFEDWVADYARANHVDPHGLIKQISARNPYLARHLSNERSSRRSG